MTNVQGNGQFNINEHFNELMKSIGLDPADTGGAITFVGEDPIMESRIRLGAAYSIPYMGTAAAAAMIWKMRTGRGQDLKIDLRKAIHYIADIPWSTLNGRTYHRALHDWLRFDQKRTTRRRTGAASRRSVFIPTWSGGGASFLAAPRRKTPSRRRSRSGMRSTSKRRAMRAVWSAGWCAPSRNGPPRNAAATGANAGDRDHQDRRQRA